jgi:hypothetical protein
MEPFVELSGPRPAVERDFEESDVVLVAAALLALGQAPT